MSDATAETAPAVAPVDLQEAPSGATDHVDMTVDVSDRVDDVTDVAAGADADTDGAAAGNKKRKKKDAWTPAQQEAYQAARAQKRHSRKAKRRDEKRARVEAQPEYVVANGYRSVAPYVYEFRTFAKQRWLGRELISMFAEEFGANSPEYYRMAILSGRVTVNDKLVTPETVIKDRDLIVHVAHRHEPPVSGEDIPVVYEDDELLVVSKPPSMPTHPCGAYRHNSLHSVVHRMRPDIPLLNIVHRLDRLTSGIVILAKTAAKAKQLAQVISDREASKTYLARVRGHLPATFDAAFQHKLAATAAANCAASAITFPDASTIHVSCPLQCQSKKDAVYECHADGKESQTLVRVLRVDNHTTLLECKPVTGRTHQIRLHLQLLGFPIANDPCYGGELHFGETTERRAAIVEAEKNKASRDPAAGDTTLDFTSPRQPHESEEAFLERTCPWCHISEEAAYNETQLHCTKIWLHALEYKLGGHVFRVPEPSWAAPSDAY